MSAFAEKQIDHLHWSDDGCATLTGPLYTWARNFDRHIEELATGKGAVDYRFRA